MGRERHWRKAVSEAIMNRRILRVSGESVSVAREARFESEAQLHNAVTANPEVLPNEDFGLGVLVPLAVELDLGSGPMDLLAADAQGHLAIVEFKRGTENSDIRHVVAQVLDYGSSLWRQEYEVLETHSGFSLGRSLTQSVKERLAELDVPFDEDTFRAGIQSSLDTGTFAFVYCGRDLDERTRRIMTYLAEGARMSFFAVEMDYYRDGAGQEAVLVPRATFVPSWVAGSTSASPYGHVPTSHTVKASAEFHEMVARMNEVAVDLDLQTSKRPTGWTYFPRELEEGIPDANSGIGVFTTGREVQFGLAVLRSLGRDEIADTIRQRLQDLSGSSAPKSSQWPYITCSSLLRDWPRARRDVIEPYFRARGGCRREEVNGHEGQVIG